MPTPTQKHKFVIDDPRKVKVVEDRGESRYRQGQRNTTGPTAISTAGTNRRVIKDVVNRLYRALEPCFLNYDNKFVPRAKFDEIVTPEVVFQILSRLRGFKDKDASSRQKLAMSIYHGGETRGPCRKLLCVLLEIERGDELRTFMQQGMSDECLPLLMACKNDDDREFHLRCRLHQDSHTRVNEFDQEYKREQFALWSRRLTPPYITWDRQSKHRHYVLEEGDPLPMVRDDRGGSGADAIMPDEGGYSEVTRVRIDDSGGKFENHTLRNPRQLYAVKKLKRHPKDDALKHRIEFDMEVLASIYAKDRAEHEDASEHRDFRKHLVPLLGTFEIRNPYNGDSTYYLLFDCAEGNLRQFWETNTAMVRDKTCLPWMAKQFSQLIGTLQCIHNDRERLRSERTWSHLYGRHGDIKPSNFLYFELPDGKKFLVISDLGLGRLHRDISRSQQDPSETPMTATYRAPEFDVTGGTISQRSDIYSMGCVFLEQITWFLLGEGAVEEFAQARITRDTKWSFDSDIFFTVSSDLRKATFKKEVKDWIRLLREQPDCCEYLHEMLELTETRMLEPDPDKRIGASDLHAELKKLESRFKVSTSFYMKYWKERRYRARETRAPPSSYYYG